VLLKHEDLMRILENVNGKFNKRNNEVLKEWSWLGFFTLVQSEQGSPGTLWKLPAVLCSWEMIGLTCSLTAAYRLLT